MFTQELTVEHIDQRHSTGDTSAATDDTVGMVTSVLQNGIDQIVSQGVSGARRKSIKS